MGMEYGDLPKEIITRESGKTTDSTDKEYLSIKIQYTGASFMIFWKVEKDRRSLQMETVMKDNTKRENLMEPEFTNGPKEAFM